jgi:hypothetical protein
MADSPRIAIVGAGPSGLFAAYELSRFVRNAKIILVDGGKRVRLAGDLQRKRIRCPVSTDGFGGAGVFCGKLYFDVAGGWLEERVGAPEPGVYMSLVSEVYEKFTGRIDWRSSNGAKVDLERYGLKFKPYPNLIHTTLENYLTLTNKLLYAIRESGAKVLFEKRVTSLSKIGASNPVFRLYLEDGSRVESDVVLLATGRGSTTWLSNQAQNLGLKLGSANPFLGVRIETLSSRVFELTNLGPDPKIKAMMDNTKLHCVCKGGRVISCRCEDMILVDGMSMAVPTRNTSFNVITRLSDFKRTAQDGRDIVRDIIQRGKGAPVVQRMGDFMASTPSTERSIMSGSVARTLQASCAGDITGPLPDEVQEPIINFISLLAGRAPKITDVDNLVYGPVFEWFCPNVEMNKKDWTTSVKGLFVTGDAAGHSQGVVMACTSGARVAFAIQSYLDNLPIRNAR